MIDSILQFSLKRLFNLLIYETPPRKLYKSSLIRTIYLDGFIPIALDIAHAALLLI